MLFTEAHFSTSAAAGFKQRFDKAVTYGEVNGRKIVNQEAKKDANETRGAAEEEKERPHTGPWALPGR